MLFNKNCLEVIKRNNKSTHPIYLSITLLFSLTFSINSIAQIMDTSVVCAGPATTGTFCYADNNTQILQFTGDDPTFPIRITFNSGNVENNFDELVVFDSDGVTNLNEATPYGDTGDLSGLTFTATGNVISFQVQSDTVFSCASGDISPEIAYEVSCLDCMNPQITFTQVENCPVSSDYTIDANVTSLGSATSLTLTDGTTPQTVTATGVVTFGPYTSDTAISITATNNDDTNCTFTSQEFEGTCPIQVICADPPLTGSYCYPDNDTEIFEFQGDGAFPLRITFPSGSVENNFDELIVLDSDGVTNLNAATPYGNAGDISGLTFTATGNTISFGIQSDGVVNCQSGAISPEIAYEVFCLQCTNPEITFTQIEDCAVSSDYTIDVDVTSLGSATSLTLTDGTTPQTVTATGVVSFGPYTPDTVISITATNDDDTNCTITSQEFEGTCPIPVICADPNVTGSYCYSDNDTEIFEFQGDSAFPLRITFPSGSVENNFDELIVLDSDGVTNLNAATPYGNAGDISGLTFTATGNTISFGIQSDGSVSCQSGAIFPEISYEVFCLECVSPEATYTVVPDCDTTTDFTIDVDIISLGSASSLTVTDGTTPQTTAATGVLTFGPYAELTQVVITVTNDDDGDCVISSDSLFTAPCPIQLVCADGGITDTFCYGEDSALFPISFENDLGFPMTVQINSGTVANFADEFIVLDSDGTNLNIAAPYGLNADGDLTGLSFTSTGDTISIFVDVSTFSTTCEEGGQTEISYTVTCNGCADDPQITYTIDQQCTKASTDFTIEVDVTDFDSLPSLTITDNQGNPAQVADATNPTLTFGPYAELTSVSFSVINDTSNCFITSEIFTSFCRIFIDTGFTTQELVEDILINSTCAEVSNFIASTGTDFGDVNGIAAFTNGFDVGFPFDEGIILTSGNVNNAPVPNGNDPSFGAALSDGGLGWPGDADLENIVGLPAGNTNNASSIEFDFVSLVPEISFNFIMASEEYNQNFECTFSDAFAFILTNQNDPTDVQNLAVLPGTTIPIQVTNIHPEVGVGQCAAVNEEFFEQYNFNPNFDPTDPDNPDNDPVPPFTDGRFSAINYNGQTVSLTAMGSVIVGNPYTIKLVIADDQDNALDTSVYLEAGSFNIGDLDLGDDILVDTGNATCDNEEVILTVAEIDGATYEWQLNGVVLPGETDPTLIVTESGTYTVTATIASGACSTSDDVVVEFFATPIIELGEDQFFCEFETVLLDATPSNPDDTGDVTYQWFLDGDPIEGEINATFEATTSGTYSVEATSVNGSCMSSDEITLTQTIFTVDIGDIIEPCGESEFEIIPDIEGIDPSLATYLWSTGETTPTITVTEDGVFSVEVTLNGCTEADEVNVNFRTIADVILLDGIEEVVKCADDEVTLEAVFTNIDASQVTFTWLLDNSVISGQTNSTIEITEEGTYTVEVSDDGCIGSDDVDIRFFANAGCIITQGISPGVSPGFNDNLDLEFLDDEANITKLSIFNRLGSLVFEMNEYVNEWAGQDMNGNELPVGTYFYVIELESQSPRTGWIYLNK